MRIVVSTSTFPVHVHDGIPQFVYDLTETLATYAKGLGVGSRRPGSPETQTDGLGQRHPLQLLRGSCLAATCQLRVVFLPEQS